MKLITYISLFFSDVSHLGLLRRLSRRIWGGFLGQFLCLAMILGFRWLPETPDRLYQLLLAVVLLCSSLRSHEKPLKAIKSLLKTGSYAFKFN